jgi:hypothetical protein
MKSNGTSNTGTFTVQAGGPFTITGQTQVVGPISGGQRIVFTGTNINSSQISVSFGGNLGIGAERLSTT